MTKQDKTRDHKEIVVVSPSLIGRNPQRRREGGSKGSDEPPFKLDFF